ncbi:MAG TPA: YebC/PmpR family DNA-binding transcriptional regulator [Armatimonadetes bacterium]|nr:YebC/PmpR family DNA-binding transcriptional regulator [Armatimonadota bacterium]
MAGHSKWATIKRAKAKTDAARGKLFSRYAREIMSAAKLGGGDPTMNPRLRLAIERSKADGLPNDNIARAIAKGTGEGEVDNTEEVTYEGYGPHGVAIIIDTMTDNRNRTVGEIRAAFNKYGGSLGESGCVAYQFDTLGIIEFEPAGRSEDDALELALEAGADDLVTDEDLWQIRCAVEQLHEVSKALTDAGLEAGDIRVDRLPQHTIELDESQARGILRLIDALEECEDVERVAANFDVSADVLAALEA